MSEAQSKLRFVITGASGLVGTELANDLTKQGHFVHRWNRSADSSQSKVFENTNVVVNLAGESIASGRWTSQRKQRLISSRVDFTKNIVSEILRQKNRPAVFISASAVGFYGDRGDDICDETSSAGSGFLADLCQAWEASTKPLDDAGIRVLLLRTGVVLTNKGGALKKMLPAFKIGIGGPLGSGAQYMSWIELHDLIQLIQFITAHDQMRGAVNAVSPNAVTNLEFSKTLAKILNRPLGPRIPEFALKLLMGEMANELLLASARIKPKAAQSHGFQFRFGDLESALRSNLER